MHSHNSVSISGTMPAFIWQYGVANYPMEIAADMLIAIN